MKFILATFTYLKEKEEFIQNFSVGNDSLYDEESNGTSNYNIYSSYQIKSFGK
jgi:hypothetical protein